MLIRVWIEIESIGTPTLRTSSGTIVRCYTRLSAKRFASMPTIQLTSVVPLYNDLSTIVSLKVSSLRLYASRLLGSPTSLDACSCRACQKGVLDLFSHDENIHTSNRQNLKDSQEEKGRRLDEEADEEKVSNSITARQYSLIRNCCQVSFFHSLLFRKCNEVVHPWIHVDQTKAKAEFFLCTSAMSTSSLCLSLKPMRHKIMQV